MSGVNRSKLAKDLRPELLSPREQKLRVWIDDVDVKVKRRLEERIKIIPTLKDQVSPVGLVSTLNDHVLFEGHNSLNTLGSELPITMEDQVES